MTCKISVRHGPLMRVSTHTRDLLKVEFECDIFLKAMNANFIYDSPKVVLNLYIYTRLACITGKTSKQSNHLYGMYCPLCHDKKNCLRCHTQTSSARQTRGTKQRTLIRYLLFDGKYQPKKIGEIFDSYRYVLGVRWNMGNGWTVTLQEKYRNVKSHWRATVPAESNSLHLHLLTKVFFSTFLGSIKCVYTILII